MNRKAEQGGYILVIAILIGILVAFYFGWISFGDKKIITPTQDELPKTGEDEQPQEDKPNTFQQCIVPADCNWDQTKYYNRNCTTGAWRCMESPQVGKFLCSYGCDGNRYAGDSICGGPTETEWNSIDCNPTVGFIGELKIG